MSDLYNALSTDDIDWCAKRLLGATIIRNLPDVTIQAVITEVESYDQTDPAAHSYKRTARSQAMYGPAGHAYIYFIYGMYYCLNVVCGPEGFGAGALIRSAQPISGLEDKTNILNGPGKLARSLQIDKSLYGHDLSQPPLKVVLNSPLPENQIVRAQRIGLSQSQNAKKRFYIKASPYISRS